VRRCVFLESAGWVVCDLLPNQAVVIVIVPSSGFLSQRNSKGVLLLLSPSRDRRGFHHKKGATNQGNALVPVNTPSFSRKRPNEPHKHVRRPDRPAVVSTPQHPTSPPPYTFGILSIPSTLSTLLHPGDQTKYPLSSSTRIW